MRSNGLLSACLVYQTIQTLVPFDPIAVSLMNGVFLYHKQHFVKELLDWDNYRKFIPYLISLIMIILLIRTLIRSNWKRLIDWNHSHFMVSCSVWFIHSKVSSMKELFGKYMLNNINLETKSTIRVAQRKRGGPITHRSLDRNQALIARVASLCSLFALDLLKLLCFWNFMSLFVFATCFNIFLKN